MIYYKSYYKINLRDKFEYVDFMEVNFMYYYISCNMRITLYGLM